MSRSFNWTKVLPSLVIPICLGMSLYFGFTVLIEREVIDNEKLVRYLTGHPVSKVTLALFFVGLASLMLVIRNVFEQFRTAEKICLPQGSKEDPGAQDRALFLIEGLMGLPSRVHEFYLWRRLHSSLHFIHRTGTADGVEDELKYLSDLDRDLQQQRYALVRILIWATPMLGFLGTVLGISEALGGINVGPENDFQQMMGGLRSSLYVAFDTTALALTLSMILMFGQFLVDRFESQLLQLVDHRARQELAEQYELSGHFDPATQAIQRIGRTVLSATQDLVERQAELWRQSMLQAQESWAATITDVHSTVRNNLTGAVDRSIEQLSLCLGQAIEKADTSMTVRWEQWQVALSNSARLMTQQQKELARQSEQISRVLNQLGNIGEFQSTLNHNLEALAATSQLQETLSQLAALLESMPRDLSSRAIVQEATDRVSSAAVEFAPRVDRKLTRAA